MTEKGLNDGRLQLAEFFSVLPFQTLDLGEDKDLLSLKPSPVDAEGGRPADMGDLIQDFLDFPRRYGLSGLDDDILFPSDDIEVSVLIGLSDVSCPDPSLFPEKPGRGLGVVEISGRVGRAMDHDFSRLSGGASGGKGSRIFCSGFNGGAYGKPQMIASLKEVEAFSPYIAPDGGYLIITKAEGGEDLIILFKKKDGTWTRGVELSGHIGIRGAFCPIVTHDGKYLFFVCGIDGKYAPYWVEASMIQDLRKEALKDDK